MADSEDENAKDLIADLIHDPVIAGSYPPFTVAADEFLGSWRLRLVCQQFDRGLHPTSRPGMEFS